MEGRFAHKCLYLGGGGGGRKLVPSEDFHNYQCPVSLSYCHYTTQFFTLALPLSKELRPTRLNLSKGITGLIYSYCRNTILTGEVHYPSDNSNHPQRATFPLWDSSHQVRSAEALAHFLLFVVPETREVQKKFAALPLDK